MLIKIKTKCNQEERNKRKKRKAFSSKPLDYCKTRFKKSSLDMLKFYVVSGGRDKVKVTDRSTTHRSIFRAPPLQR